MAEASQQRAHTLRTTMSTVVGKGNSGEVRDIMRLAAALGFDAVHLRRLIAVDDASASLVPSHADLSAIPRHEVTALGVDLGLEVSSDYLAPRWNLSFTGIPLCTSPWEFAFIRANGDVQPCSNLWDSQVAPVMGNALEDDFAAIWHGERLREFRRASALGTNPLCSQCGDNCWV
jgi:radical SAM protein with 4Fe4S-binding SPASM domain